MALTAKTLTSCGVRAELARTHLPHMARAMRAHRITTRPRARAFLATVLHESMGLRAMSELGGGARYQGRLGNTRPGDGERYKGRGPIQLTGRDNYAHYGTLLGLDLVGHPELVATPKVGWQVAACYFAKRAGVLQAADAGDFRRVTRLVNGGYNGWEDRKRYWDKLAKLGVVPAHPVAVHAGGHAVAVPKPRHPRPAPRQAGAPAHATQPKGNLPTATAPRSGDGRAAGLWKRLERLDRESDRVRAGLRTVAPPPLTSAEGLTDEQLVKRLERADGQCDLLRKALVTRVERAVQAPPAEDLLVVIARELSGVSTRLSDVASGHAAPPEAPAEAPAAPPVAGPAPAAPAAAAELEALDARSDALRAQLEDALLARSAPDGHAGREKTCRYLELLTRLDRLDAESDRVRAALRPGGHGAKLRTFRVRSPEMKGEDVRGWQRFLNATLRAWHVGHDVAVDGEYGTETARWTRRVLYGLGIAIADGAGLTPQARIKARHPERRTAAERTAGRARRAWRERLARHHVARRRGRQAALAYARVHADRGTAETHVNGGPHIDDWCRMVHMQPGTATSFWCGAFVNACLVKGGQPSRDWLRYTPSIVNKAKAGEEGFSWHSSPKVGDLVLFNWPGGDFVDHVGLVLEVKGGGRVRTVEGNISDRVGYHDRSVSILGYARPPWR